MYPNTTSTPSPYQEWLSDLEIEVLKLEDSAVECDGMTWLISYALRAAGVDFAVMQGYVQHQYMGLVAPHYWIEMPLGYVIDLRLRLWFGDEDEVPHGIFHPDCHEAFKYVGTRVDGLQLSEALASCLSDKRIEWVRIPCPPNQSHAYKQAISVMSAESQHGCARGVLAS